MSDRISVYASDNMSVWCSPGAKRIEHEIHKPTAGKIFHDALSAGVEAMKKHGCTQWLSDDRKNAPLTAEDLQWAESYWSNEAIAAGWKSWALVLPSESLAQMNLQAHARVYRKRGVVVLTFLEPNAAREWLSTR